MQHVLHGVDGDRPVLASQVQNTLDPQQVLAAGLDQHFQPQSDTLPMQRTVEGQAKGRNALVMVVVMMRVRFGVQPAGDVRDFRLPD